MTTATDTTFNVGDRVRLIDAEGDGSSSATTGDTGTITSTRPEYEGLLLIVMMDDGHTTSRFDRRWEKVTDDEPMSEADARAVWAALPIEQAYPIGSRWHHSSYGDTVHTVAEHVRAPWGEVGSRLNMRDENTGIVSDWPRGALDLYGSPVGLPTATPEAPEEPFPVGYQFTGMYNHDREVFTVTGHDGDLIDVTGTECGKVRFTRVQVATGTPVPTSTETLTEPTEAPTEAPVAPYSPQVGDRVIVTDDRDDPSNNGKAATVVGVGGDTLPVCVDYSPNGYSRWWVKEVRPFMPTTEEEFKAAIEAAKEAGLRDGVTAGRREGREEADREFEAWKESANKTAIEYANENSLCKEFDKCMLAIGLNPRDSFEGVEWDVTVSFTVTARDDEDAMEKAQEYMRNGYVDSYQVNVEES